MGIAFSFRLFRFRLVLCSPSAQAFAKIQKIPSFLTIRGRDTSSRGTTSVRLPWADLLGSKTPSFYHGNTRYSLLVSVRCTARRGYSPHLCRCLAPTDSSLRQFNTVTLFCSNAFYGYILAHQHTKIKYFLIFSYKK